jgi:hypothetical protein
MVFFRRIILFLLPILIFVSCPLRPPKEAKPMTVNRQVRAIFQFGKPITVGVLDEGDEVRAMTTTEPGWCEIWWFKSGKWKYGYVPDDCLQEKRGTGAE